ncbi:major facilitator superfamily domain-containing protein [Aspergillus californicus]
MNKDATPMGDVNYVEHVGQPKQQPQESWSKEEKRALRRLDWHLIPLLGGLYLCSYMDRGNIGNAYTAGMGDASGITSSQYSMVVIVYYIAYISFHWVLDSSLKGGSSAAFGSGDGSGLLALRILVGIFEAGFAPAIALYLSFFYHRREMGLRYGLFMSCSPLANGIASAIVYGVVHSNSALEAWQLIFLIGKGPVLLHDLRLTYAQRAPRGYFSRAWLENRRRNREFGPSDPRYAPPDISDKGDEHPMYRFVL